METLQESWDILEKNVLKVKRDRDTLLDVAKLAVERLEGLKEDDNYVIVHLISRLKTTIEQTEEQ